MLFIIVGINLYNYLFQRTHKQAVKQKKSPDAVTALAHVAILNMRHFLKINNNNNNKVVI